MTRTASSATERGTPTSDPVDLSLIDHILQEFKGEPGAILPILQRTQDTYGYLPREALRYIADKNRVPLNQLHGVATFYRGFYLKPRGKHIIRLCDGTACHVRGAAKNIDAIRSELNIGPGETTDDRLFTLEIVYCLGSCGLAPVALVDEKVHGRLGPEALVGRLKRL